MDKKNPSCTSCNSSNTCPIVWGYPAEVEEALDAAAKGEILLGGCCVSDNDPVWHCNDCQHRWGKSSEENEV